MKQVIQNYRTGELKISDVPTPQGRPSSVLVRTLYSAISAGTEKTKVDTARMSLMQKARSRPDLVKKVFDKVRKEGLMSTYEMVQKRLNEPVPLGYSCVGVVEEVGEWVDGVQVGDVVACAGAGSANHAEMNVVPGRLVARCPEGTPLDQAAFTTIGSIALQGVRQTDPKIGERIVVLGMGLLGQITAQLLKANGCSVFAVDLDPWKLEIAQKSGCVAETALGSDSNLMDKIRRWSRGRGADAVILTASTPSDTPIEQAGEMCRERGRVVIVGAVGTKFPREPYYLKEVEIRIARSYGPGRYDPMYEELGLDYPVGYVRFTEQRNMEAFLDLLASKQIDLSHLLTHRFSIEDGTRAFDLLHASNTTERYLGIVLEYPKAKTAGTPQQKPVETKPASGKKGQPLDLGFVGLGNYATAQLLPKLKSTSGVKLREVVTGSGMSSAVKGKQFGFETIVEKPESLLNSPNVGTVFVVTRHDTHGRYVTQALRSGKNVFVEKPLCLTPEELPAIREAYEASDGLLCVGFNRRFSPLVQEVRGIFPDGARHISYRVNAGRLPADHWLKVPEVGGGRIIGEGCHFIDLAAHLANSEVSSVYARAIGGEGSVANAMVEDVHITLGFRNGAVASILYFSTGDSKLPKEYLEVHGDGKSAIIDDYLTLQLPGQKPKKLQKQDKGQEAMLQKFMEACRSGNRKQAPISDSSLWNSTEATFAVIESLCTGKPVFLGRSE